MTNMRKTRFWVQAAIIAAVYAVLTVAFAPISYGPIQVRISEALTILPFFTPAAVPGLFVGCLTSNLLSPYGALDIVCGSLASLLAAGGSYALRGAPALVPLPPVAANALIIGAMLRFAYGVEPSFWICALWVGAGEVAACYVLGYPLMLYMRRHKDIFRLD
ncbi:MAG: QueT transporter family protein [Clostridiales Family XIII bacterium]|jgi:uncharacterized membrane protein|nr:QueT transporter family protein [Clostridiales Family XIII bacterium]